MTLGDRASMSLSKGHKINVKSSTESELLGIDDSLPDILWGKYFIEAQGHTVKHNILLQDNQSTILLAKNRTLSSSKKTKHIRHKLYPIKDKIAQGDVDVQYEPTGTTWCDILTNPRQGAVFCKCRGHLMKIP